MLTNYNNAVATKNNEAFDIVCGKQYTYCKIHGVQYDVRINRAPVIVSEKFFNEHFTKIEE